MLSKNKIKYINSLYINKFRIQHNAFVVEGTKLLDELLKSNFHIVEMFVTEHWLQANAQLLERHPFSVIDPNAMSQISKLSTPPGALAIVSIPKINYSPEHLKIGLSLAVDGINDPGNLGTIIRTADWFGVQHIYCSPDTVDAFHPKVVQATMGSIFRVQVVEYDLSSLLVKANEQNVPVYGAVLNGESLYNIRGSVEAALLVIGSESHGIRSNLLPHISRKISIPYYATETSFSKPESLNASIATAIILSEFRRTQG